MARFAGSNGPLRVSFVAGLMALAPLLATAPVSADAPAFGLAPVQTPSALTSSDSNSSPDATGDTQAPSDTAPSSSNIPVIAFIEPSADQPISGHDAPVSTTLSQSGLHDYRLQIDTTAIAFASDPTVGTQPVSVINTTNFTDGAHTLTATVEDANGTTSTETLTVVILN